MQSALSIGVDVAKKEVVAACADQTFAPRTVPNSPAALKAWLKRMPNGSRIGLEATGNYHQTLADLACTLGFTVYLLNPRDTRHYARALGRRAKTDRVDAELIARFVAHEHAGLRPYVPPSSTARRVDQLLRRRAKLVAIKGAAAMTLKGISGFATERKSLLVHFDQLIERIDRELAARMEASAEHRPVCARLREIVGVGPLVGAGLANVLIRVPFRSADAFIAFTGLDPRARDSGEKTGRRRLSKRGPSELRRLLFNAAMSAARTTTWRPIYEHYRSRGLPTTAALVVIARKIARAAWSMHHYQSSFDPGRIMPSLT